jgi:molybdopterin molybdotransferase
MEAIDAQVSSLAAATVPLGEAAGRYLAEALLATSDMPPFDRSAMDGYAVRSEDASRAPVELEVIEEIAAGHDPREQVASGQASRIMTGAAVPGGADAVVMVERTESLEGGRRVRLLAEAKRGQHIRRAGEDLGKGSLLLEPGTYLGAPEVALLAAEGRAQVKVGSLPSVALLSTGDELVGIDRTPRGSQIRETNSWSLSVLLGRMGIEARTLAIAPDEPEALSVLIAQGIGGDAFILTGGVSMGEYDLVGEELEKAGCRPIFERVAIQPGKPLFFGVAGGPGTLVFGLPGNPVSAVVDFLVFVRPALRRMMGARRWKDSLPVARLAETVRRKPGRRGYLAARVAPGPDGRLEARPLRSMGSADMVALSRANAFLVAGESFPVIEEGAQVPVMFLDDPFTR